MARGIKKKTQSKKPARGKEMPFMPDEDEVLKSIRPDAEDPDAEDPDNEGPGLLEAAAKGIGAASGALGGLGGGQGQMVQPAATVGKGGLSPVDPEMRTRKLKEKLSGRGGPKFKKGGSVRSRDGIAIRGKTRGRFV